MSPPQTVLFDLDGTLTDPKEGITRSIQYALEKAGTQVPATDELTWCIGPPLLESFKKLLGQDAGRASLAVNWYRERFASVGLFENTPYPGIHEALSQLQTIGIPLYVASSKPGIYVRKILEHFDLNAFFEGVYGSELDGTRANKSELLRFVLNDAIIDPRKATMVGDRKHDMLGARDNGVATLGVLYGYGSRDELREAGADRLANSTADLVSLLA